MKEFSVFSDTKKTYQSMLKDIREAKKSVFLETYIYEKDDIGRKFRDLLIKKAKEGIEVKVLIDSWASNVDKDFFKKLVSVGGEVRFFREFRYVVRIFSKNHERNHRKLLLVDKEIAYLGSLNIMKEALDWRELVLKLKGPIAQDFESSFFQSWEIYGKFTKVKMKNLIHKGFEIIPDKPSNIYRPVEKRYKTLIRFAKEQILMETPYFVPSRRIKRAIMGASRRGVKVILIVPKVSDVKPVDILSNRYFGKLYKSGVQIFYYNSKDHQKILHSKLLIVDNKVFILGSSNVDYRSFIHNYELNLLGRNREIVRELKRHFQETLSKCERFNYAQWRSRSSFSKMLEMFLGWIREYF